MKIQDWIGREIVSQYGLLCEVLDANEKDNKIIIKCQAHYNGKIWEWESDTVSLVTKQGEMLDPGKGEVFGKIVDGRWNLYSEEQCRIIPKEEVEEEFQR
jgi:hypothetical protein